MDFSEQLSQFASRISRLKDSIATEETTKTSLILPFFQLLGYDIFNPFEFVPEFTADIGTKKGEKVDYAILMSNDPIILIEAKPVNTELSHTHTSQLYRYFSVTKARFAILTNGIVSVFILTLKRQIKWMPSLF